MQRNSENRCCSDSARVSKLRTVADSSNKLRAFFSARKTFQQRAEGYALYEEKPNLRRKGKSTAENADGGNVGCGTWSDAEYGLAGFQWMYLRLKSFQRFTETWALLDRCVSYPAVHSV
eukprot:SAG31_NODE_764_length_12262_cov_26.578887_12_plen_119_part_00